MSDPTPLHRQLTPDRVIAALLVGFVMLLAGTAVLAVTGGIIVGGAAVWLWVTDPDQP